MYLCSSPRQSCCCRRRMKQQSDIAVYFALLESHEIPSCKSPCEWVFIRRRSLRCPNGGDDDEIESKAHAIAYLTHSTVYIGAMLLAAFLPTTFLGSRSLTQALAFGLLFDLNGRHVQRVATHTVHTYEQQAYLHRLRKRKKNRNCTSSLKFTYKQLAFHLNASYSISFNVWVCIYDFLVSEMCMYCNPMLRRLI